jgi:hypothetical protein
VRVVALELHWAACNFGVGSHNAIPLVRIFDLDANSIFAMHWDEEEQESGDNRVFHLGSPFIGWSDLPEGRPHIFKLDTPHDRRL